MRLGIDVSTYYETMGKNAKYYDGGKEVDPLDLFRVNGVDCMRIRLWNDPYDEHGAPYLGGTCDLVNALKLCDLAKSKGCKVMFDFHYSDFWADPGKQFLPKAWTNLTFDELVAAVERFTLDTLNALKAHGADLEYIQVGNEITNGMLWPHGKLEGENGKRTGYGKLIPLLKAGIAACRKVYPAAKLILHLERSYDQVVYNEFFTHMAQENVDFDVIGFSYYPYWHGTFEQFFANFDMCKKFGKELAVVELGYAFTLEPFIREEHGAAKLQLGAGDVETSEFAKTYPISPAGQAAFVRDFLRLAQRHGASMVCWWEPIWVHADGTCWTSPEGQRYINETGKSRRNEWANQCLFGYDNQMLPAFKEYSIKKR